MMGWIGRGELGRWERRLLLFSAALVLLSFAFPLWQVRLIAPQYPEGLTLAVYAWGLRGKLDIINTLNHYVGMREIRPEDFPELRLIPVAFLGVALLATVAAWTGRRWIPFLLIVLAPVALLGILDLWYRLYLYGHTLDPDAPIRVPPFTPPILGSQRLANFITSATFHVGTLLHVIAFVLVVLAFWRSSPWRGRSRS
ncbi:MAG: hypothetical protein QN198_02700 [Armatimonadota bacterium]|nr:hypothetical protein [Armatimonadota bacterium]MDR5702494.1 hypothetical protein [Armatimonadota bacterium]MDR7433592.1 hypothetical protein [Armatimonadota bacterium]